MLCYAGADTALIDAAIGAGAKGIVSAGFAPGIANPGQQIALAAAAKTSPASSTNPTGKIALSCQFTRTDRNEKSSL